MNDNTVRQFVIADRPYNLLSSIICFPWVTFCKAFNAATTQNDPEIFERLVLLMSKASVTICTAAKLYTVQFI